jgi:opacity protein-like surface antigen
MKCRAVGLVAFGIGLVAAPLAAQTDVKTRGYFGVGGGLSIPVGDFGDVAKTGWVGSAFGGFTTKGGIFGGRADLMWAQNGLDGVDGHQRMLGANVDVVLTPGHRPANVHPYFLAGVGVYNGKTSVSVGSGDATKLALNAGVGVQIHTGHRMDVFFEGRIVSFRASDALNFLPLVIGLRWGGI